MKNISTERLLVLIPISFVIFMLGYYCIPEFITPLDNIFISITIFLFATLVGFFISRQATRYGQIIMKVTDFDGNMSYLYRSISVFGDDAQTEITHILKKHYQTISESNTWDVYFNQKTTTLTDINALVNKYTSNGELNPAQSAFASRAYFGLGEMQKIRKNLIALYKEKIPSLQWLLVIFLTLVLILTVSAIPSHAIFVASAVKAAFVVSVVSVVIMLLKLNHLSFFEEMVGKSSAQDVLDIISGER